MKVEESNYTYFYPTEPVSPQESALFFRALNDEQTLIARLWAAFLDHVFGYVEVGSGRELKKITATFFSTINTSPSSQKNADQALELLYKKFLNRVTKQTDLYLKTDKEIGVLFKKFICNQAQLKQFKTSEPLLQEVLFKINKRFGITEADPSKEHSGPLLTSPFWTAPFWTARNIKILCGSAVVGLALGFSATLLYPLFAQRSDCKSVIDPLTLSLEWTKTQDQNIATSQALTLWNGVRTTGNPEEIIASIALRVKQAQLCLFACTRFPLKEDLSHIDPKIAAPSFFPVFKKLTVELAQNKAIDPIRPLRVPPSHSMNLIEYNPVTQSSIRTTLSAIHKQLQKLEFGKPGAQILKDLWAGPYSKTNRACPKIFQKVGCQGIQNPFLKLFGYTALHKKGPFNKERSLKTTFLELPPLTAKPQPSSLDKKASSLSYSNPSLNHSYLLYTLEETPDWNPNQIKPANSTNEAEKFTSVPFYFKKLNLISFCSLALINIAWVIKKFYPNKKITEFPLEDIPPKEPEKFKMNTSSPQSTDPTEKEISSLSLSPFITPPKQSKPHSKTKTCEGSTDSTQKEKNTSSPRSTDPTEKEISPSLSLSSFITPPEQSKPHSKTKTCKGSTDSTQKEKDASSPRSRSRTIRALSYSLSPSTTPGKQSEHKNMLVGDGDCKIGDSELKPSLSHALFEAEAPIPEVLVSPPTSNDSELKNCITIKSLQKISALSPEKALNVTKKYISPIRSRPPTRKFRHEPLHRLIQESNGSLLPINPFSELQTLSAKTPPKQVQISLEEQNTTMLTTQVRTEAEEKPLSTVTVNLSPKQVHSPLKQQQITQMNTQQQIRINNGQKRPLKEGGTLPLRWRY